MKIPACHLLRGDQIGSGEIVLGVSAGVRTPPRKVEVTLAKGERRHCATWGAHTLITVAGRGVRQQS